MTKLSAHIKTLIRQNGPMPVDVFMALALGHPEHGYYMKKDPFGAAGDFTTAPEISQMFGELLGAWAADIWMQMGQPERFTLLECGPGRGTLMADMMRAVEPVPGFHEAVSIHLLEMSPVLREKQAAALGAYDVLWHESLEDVPDDRPVIVMANEFFDALPVKQFIGGVERCVGLDGDEFVFISIPPPNLPPEGGGIGPELAAPSPPCGEGRGGGEDIYETSPARAEFMKALSALMNKAGGAGLVIDYGHTKSAAGDTLQALYKHEFCDVLAHIGDADITAHVDFQALGAAAQVNVYGPMEQGAFLKALGVEHRARALLARADERQSKEIYTALNRLSRPDQMGALFKVMGLSYGYDFTFSGFPL